MSSNIAPESYIFKFGKYANMRAVDVSDLYKVNPKTGQDEAVGLKYLHFLVEKCSWFRDTEMIKKVIEMAESNMSEEADSEPEPKPEPKKKKDSKKSVKVTINASDVSKVIDFQN